MTRTSELHQFLRSRRSIRRFQPKTVPDSVLEEILRSAMHAPSAHNRQPWRFVILADPSVRAQLAEAMAEEFSHDLLRDGMPADKIEAQTRRSRERIASAPAAVLLCLDSRELDFYPDEIRQRAEHTMAVQSVAAAGLQLMLAAHAEGLGAVWACWPLFAQETVKRALDLPATWEPQGMFFLGYPAAEPKAKQLKDLEGIIKRI